jgi:hypothetical protein
MFSLVLALSMSLAAAAPAPPVLDFRFTDIDGNSSWLSELPPSKAYLIVLREVGCPISGKYAPKTARLAAEYAAKGVTVLYLNLNPTNTVEQIRSDELGRHGFAGRYIHDPEQRIGRILGVRSTGEMFVLDATRRLQYRGPVDDQHGITFTRPKVQKEHLKEALNAVLAGKAPREAEVTAEGCLLGLDKVATLPAAPTFHKEVSRIVQANCQTCHRQDGMGPFALETYEQVHSKREMIAYMVKQGLMPPWYAHKDVGEWANDRSLSEGDLLTLLRWVDEGAPAGRRADAPAPRTWSSAWNIGQPDAVVRMDKAFPIPAEGVLEYQNFYVKTDFAEDKWITAMEMRPGALQQVHHALVFIEEPGTPQRQQQGGLNGFFAAYAPGAVGITFPDGAAKKLPKGATLKFQMHYTTNGVPAADVTELGFRFADAPPTAEVMTWTAVNVRFEIPAGDPNYEVVAERRFPVAGTLLNFFPHMHVRGKAFRMELIQPDGTVQRLLEVPRYDFNWQLAYELKTPITVPAGARIRATAWYDNSPGNRSNPDPTKVVRFGEQSWDEMMIGYFDWIPDRRAASGN